MINLFTHDKETRVLVLHKNSSFVARNQKYFWSKCNILLHGVSLSLFLLSGWTTDMSPQFGFELALVNLLACAADTHGFRLKSFSFRYCCW